MQTEKLIKRFLNGDELAAQQLYHQYARATYNSLLRLNLDPALAQDLLQESFIKAFQDLSKLKEPAAFGAWLKRIALNLGLQEIRKQIKWESLDEGRPLSSEDEPNWPEIEFEHLHKAIAELPLGCRTVFQLYYLEDYSHQEIAREMQISSSTSKSQLHYAKQQLREKLQRFYET